MTEYTPIPAHPDKIPLYSSKTIQERRKRILREARKMIATGGVEKFSIRTLCKNADVAQRTFYNAFQSKDRIIALAIRDAYDDVNSYIRYRTSATALEGIVDRLISINSRNLKARNYTKAVTTIYFSPDISKDIWDTLREMVFINLRQWLKQVSKKGDLESWIDADDLAGDFANIEYSVIHDWASGRLTDDQYIKRLITAVLSHAAGVTTGATREEAVGMLRKIQATGKLPQFPKPVFAPPKDVESASA